jgi:hypothetical protein
MAINVVTTLLSAVALGGTGGHGNASQTTANTSTSAFVIRGKIDFTAIQNEPGSEFTVYYASLHDDLSSPTAAALVAALYKTAKAFSYSFPAVVPSGSVVYFNTELEVLTGEYVYVWVESPKTLNTFDLTLDLVEIV